MPWWGLVALAVLLLVSVSAWITLRGDPNPALGAPSIRTVELTVNATPPESEILMNGERLGYGRYRGDHPATEAKSVIEVRAAGHAKERKYIVLDRDMVVDFSLRPIPARVASTAAPSPSTSVGAVKDDTPSTAKARTPRPPRIRQRPVPVAPQPSATARPEPADCDPPYTFSADGVKAFKPECF
jgi:hypothetical protein